MNPCFNNELDIFLLWLASGYANNIDGFIREILLIIY